MRIYPFANFHLEEDSNYKQRLANREQKKKH